MAKDIYGRTLCKREECAAYSYIDNQEVCNARLMYYSKTNILCDLSDKYIIVLDEKEKESNIKDTL